MGSVAFREVDLRHRDCVGSEGGELDRWQAPRKYKATTTYRPVLSTASSVITVHLGEGGSRKVRGLGLYCKGAK